MTPVYSKDLVGFTIVQEPSKTYYIDFEKGIIRGFCDGLTAIKQAIYKVLNTERYDWLIYSWNYGVELKSLFGQPMSYVQPEIKRAIEEALLQDDRIKEVGNFSFDKKRNSLYVKFSVATTLGDVESEVIINV